MGKKYQAKKKSLKTCIVEHFGFVCFGLMAATRVCNLFIMDR